MGTHNQIKNRNNYSQEFILDLKNHKITKLKSMISNKNINAVNINEISMHDKYRIICNIYTSTSMISKITSFTQ